MTQVIVQPAAGPEARLPLLSSADVGLRTKYALSDGDVVSLRLLGGSRACDAQQEFLGGCEPLNIGMSDTLSPSTFCVSASAARARR